MLWRDVWSHLSDMAYDVTTFDVRVDQGMMSSCHVISHNELWGKRTRKILMWEMCERSDVFIITVIIVLLFFADLGLISLPPHQRHLVAVSVLMYLEYGM